ncbi:HNH endonuclease [Williamsia phyllosphaerae]|uniref:HNH endonuclease n=1 Tax=Williamsia phyllosphaerae TaxID=885042 RepID=A0ABQ1V2N5_9NOCA|nr:HNH endonuclease signature motif containing protein [Williamsia phyllosphaerae]GGF32881.1 HNH endonuclease [Williamsia phyllosphaerae]
MSGGTLTDIANAVVDEYGCRETVVGDVDDEIVAAIRGAVALRAVADDVLARLSAQAERVGTAKRSGMSLRELLCANGMAPAVAARVIRLGRAMQVLTRVARHSRDASVSAEHLDAVARGVEHVVRRTGETVDSEAIGGLEGSLIGQAVAGAAPAEIVERARAVAIEMTVAAPGDGDDPDRLPPAEDSTVNELAWRTGDDGRLRGEFDLDALTAERFITTLDTASRPRPEPDGSDDPRTATRRRADAFSQLLECGSRGLSPDASHGPPRTEVLLTIPVDADAASGTAGPAWLSWMGPISDLSAKLVSCDARLAGVGLDLNGAPVSVTAPERLFTGAARKVVLQRDRGCIKCGAPASWCDVHHIIYFADGGPTTVDNGCLLCRSCHAAVHHAGWDIVMGADRHPWLIPPASVDPQRRPLPAYNRRTLRLDDPVAA